MKRIGLLIFALTLLMSCAAAETCGDFTYRLRPDGGAVITGYTGSAAELVIPSELDGHPVKEIGDWAFFPSTGEGDPGVMYGDAFLQPGTYLSAFDADLALFNSTARHRITLPDAAERRAAAMIPESHLREMVRFLARLDAWKKGYTVFPDMSYDINGRLEATDVNAIIDARIARLQAESEAIALNIQECKEQLEGASERVRKRFQLRIDSLRDQMTAVEAEITSIQAKMSDGRYITDADAIAMWTAETGLSADSECREQLLELWASEFDTVMSAAGSEELRLLGIEGFNNGMHFLSAENGLRFQQIDCHAFTRISRMLSLDVNGRMQCSLTPGEPDQEPLTFDIRLTDFVRLEDVANVVSLPMGTDQFGYDLSLTGESPLTSVVIPEGVTRIGRSAFLDCRQLTSVTLPASLESWEPYAFSVRVARPEMGTGDVAGWYQVNEALTFTVVPGSMPEEACVRNGYPHVTAE